LHGGEVSSVLTRWLPAADQRTDTEGRRPFGPADARTRMLVAGSVAGLGAAGAGLVILGALTGLAWIVEPAVGGSILGPTRLASQAWLLGHGADVVADGVLVAVTPLGLTVLLVVCCWYPACWVGRRAQVASLGGIAYVLAALVFSYSTVGIGLALIATSSGTEIGWGSVLLGAVGLSVLVGGTGLLRTAGHGRLIHDIAPFPSRAVLSGAGAGAAALLAAGLVTVGIAIAVDRAGFAALTDSLAPGWTAGIGLLVLSLLLLPNAALYAVAVLLGPGFAVGSATTVSAFGVTLGSVPGLPILAALPDTPAVPLGVLLGLTIPALCGLAVGAVVVRRLDDDVSQWPAAGWAASAGVALAIGLGAAQWLAGGSLGEGGLSIIGAPPVASVAAAAGLLALPAALSAAFSTRRQRRR